MSKKVARKGDPTSHGGVILTGSSKRMVNDKEVARITDTVSCPIEGHGVNAILTGSTSVFVEGQGVAFVGSTTACGATITDGSPSVFAEPKSDVAVVYEHDGVQVEYSPADVAYAANDDEESSVSFDGEMPENNPTEEDTDTPADVTPLPANCNGILDTSPESIRLSPNFILSNLTSGTALSRTAARAQRGKSRAQIICNLRALAINCLEPIATQYGRKSMIITSGFRHPKGSNVSQHELGEAIDLQFSGISDDEYWERAKWVRDNVAYDQFILEYLGNRPWFHLSYREGRVRHEVKTCTTPGQYPAGLRKGR